MPGLVTERTKIAENRHQRQPPHGRNQSRMASPPRHQNAFPLHPLKSVFVSRPQAGLFSILHARALLPPRSVPNCKQTGIGKGGAVAPPNSFDHESQNCPGQGKAENGRRRRAIFHTRARRGLVLARNAPSIVQPVCACQCIARPVPSALHILTVLDRLGDFASRISRREFCQEQQPSRSRTNGDGNSSTNSRHEA